MNKRRRTAKALFAAWWLIVLSILIPVFVMFMVSVGIAMDTGSIGPGESGAILSWCFGACLLFASSCLAPGILVLHGGRRTRAVAMGILSLEFACVVGAIVWGQIVGIPISEIGQPVVYVLGLYGIPLALVLLDGGRHRAAA